MKKKTVESVVKNLELNFSSIKARLKNDLEKEKITKTQYLSWVRRETKCLKHEILAAYHSHAEMFIFSNQNLETTEEEVPGETVGSYNVISNFQNTSC